MGEPPARSRRSTSALSSEEVLETGAGGVASSGLSCRTLIPCSSDATLSAVLGLELGVGGVTPIPSKSSCENKALISAFSILCSALVMAENLDRGGDLDRDADLDRGGDLERDLERDLD